MLSKQCWGRGAGNPDLNCWRNSRIVLSCFASPDSMHSSSRKSPAVKKSLETTGNPNPSPQRRNWKEQCLSRVAQLVSVSVMQLRY